jgi:hypothetical protein
MLLSEIRLALLEEGTDEGSYLGCQGKAPQRVNWVPRLPEDIKGIEITV